MDFLLTHRIQIIVIFISSLLLIYIAKKILNGKLREEYSIIWLILSLIIIIFSIWREGLEIISGLLGVYSAPNLIFTISIFFIYVYLIHISIVNTKLQNSIKSLLQKIAILEQKLSENKEKEREK